MLRSFTRDTFFLLLVFLISIGNVNAQESTILSGNVKDKNTGEGLVGVNVVIKGRVVGTITDYKGDFRLETDIPLPLTLMFTYVGYSPQEIEVTNSNSSSIIVVMSDQVILGEEVVVSASRMEQSIMDSPVSIEKMGIADIKNTASDDYYKAIAGLKGVDVSTSSINFQILNSRGFGSTGNTRFVQLTDMMDTQAPALNFPIGNLNGPSLLDVESVEFIPGAASALYGPNAFNGILLVTSKNPFEYQGLSAFAKIGVNHIADDAEAGAPDTPKPLYEASVRYAKAIGKFAFKVNLSYMKAEDWYGLNYDDKNKSQQRDLAANPSFDGVHMFGDDGGINLGLLRRNQLLIGNVSAGLQAKFGLDENTANQQAAMYVGSLPADNVNRTGYQERYLVDYGAENLKLGVGLNYKLKDNLEASYTLNYGYGTSVYTGAQRYSLVNFNIQQHKLELEGDNFVVRGYTTIEQSGDSYIADFTGYAINNTYLENSQWFGQYAGGIVLDYITKTVIANQGNPMFDQSVIDGILNDPNNRTALHNSARNNLENGIRYQPGSPLFEAANEAINSAVIPNGAKFDDNTRFYQIDGQYNFSKQITAFELMVGGQWRQFDLRSNGTIFPDNEGDGIQINEYGAYVQAGKKIANEKFHLRASLRYDKNENFDGQYSPRFSGVFNANKHHAIRASYQTGFRNPTTQGQYIDLDVVSARLLGGLPQFTEKYRVLDNTYSYLSVENYTNDYIEKSQANPNYLPNVSLLVPFDFWEPVKPEKVQVIEIGYRGIINEKLMYDISYYRNIYNDFITQVRVRQSQALDTTTNQLVSVPAQDSPFSLLSGDATNTFQIYTNNSETVRSQGAALGLDYLFSKGYKLSGNYSWNKLNEDDLSGEFINDYNTPEHTVNLSLSNRKVVDNLGFNIAWRWQSAFDWQSSFARGPVPSVSILDAQLSYTVASLKSIVKLGASNLTNQYYITNYGSPSVGGIYYISIMFDEMFR